jgi:DNA mismatch repair protein MutH
VDSRNFRPHEDEGRKFRGTIALVTPSTAGDLLTRATALHGMTVAELAERLAVARPGRGAKHKGKVGTLVETALGASAGSSARPDFPHLGIELKTVPVDAAGHPYESTFVCSVSLQDADRAEWESSVARAKLHRVLWVPIIGRADIDAELRTFGRPILWSPSAEQESQLRFDFEDIMGRIGAGGIEALSAHIGEYLQLRPKAASGRERTFCTGRDGEWVATVPRGFYLRARFTASLLSAPND